MDSFGLIEQHTSKIHNKFKLCKKNEISLLFPFFIVAFMWKFLKKKLTMPTWQPIIMLVIGWFTLILQGLGPFWI